MYVAKRISRLVSAGSRQNAQLTLRADNRRAGVANGGRAGSKDRGFRGNPRSRSKSAVARQTWLGTLWEMQPGKRGIITC